MSILISYELSPPADVQAGNLHTSKTETFPVGSIPDDHAKYYGALHKAIEEARDQLGNELTAWRDAVGKAELSKETPNTLNYDADGEGDPEDEQS